MRHKSSSLWAGRFSGRTKKFLPLSIKKIIGRFYLQKNKKIMFGLLGLGFIVFCTVLAPVIWPYDPLAGDLQYSLKGPSFQHPFGLDENGLDLLSQVLYGARLSLLVAFSVVSLSLLIGLIIGSLSGWYGALVDQFLMRVVDMVSAFPRFLLALSLLAMLGASLFNLILALCLSGWAGFARLVRAEVLHLKKEEYVLSALSTGATPLRVLVFHIWPNLLGPLMVQSALALVAVVIAEAGLSFLGLGVPPDIPSWGRLISSGRQLLGEAPHLSLFPGMAIFLLVLSFQLCGDGLRDFFDPKRS